jgi:hypothetical protein
VIEKNKEEKIKNKIAKQKNRDEELAKSNKEKKIFRGKIKEFIKN